MSEPVTSGLVRAVRVGPAVRQCWSGRTLVTAAHKEPVAGPVAVGRLGLAGDEQGNRKVHGGPDKAVLVYPFGHYAAWREAGIDVPEGGLFENITLDGPTEADVRLGDVWQLGTARVQVTQPRRPCRTIADRWGRPGLAREVQEEGRTGFYLRVLDEGVVAAGDTMVLLERPAGAVSAAEVSRVMNLDRRDQAGIEALLAAPELPEAWRSTLTRRLAGALEDDSRRLGPVSEVGP